MARVRQEGFALVEAIAALAVSALAAAGLMATLGSVGARSKEADVRAVALRQAELVLADALAASDLNLVPRQGEDPSSRSSWRVAIDAPDDGYPGILQVRVDVSWQVGRKQGGMQLAAYRLAPPP